MADPKPFAAYPAVRHRKPDGEQTRTNSPEEDAALGAGWYTTPTFETELNAAVSVVDDDPTSTLGAGSMAGHRKPKNKEK